MTYSDPDFSTIYSRASAAGSPARVNDTAGQLAATSGKLTGTTDGKGPDKFTGDAVTIGQTLAGLATDAAISTDVWGDLKKAADAWKAAAPTAEVMNAAEKAVTDAQTACTAANEKAEASPDDKDLAKKADDAGEALIKAKQALIDLQRKRKAANKALLEAIARAITKAKRITGGQTPFSRGTGKEVPGASTAQSTGTGSAGSDAPAASPGGTPKPTTGTPTATPTSNTPSTNTNSSKGTGLTPAEAATLVAAAQNQQQPQAQQASAQQMPTMPQVQPTAQQQGDKDKEKGDPSKTLLEEAERNSPAILAAAGITNPTTTVTGAGSTPSSTPAPVSNGNSTTLRGPDAKIAGVGLNGSPAVNTQNPATSGNSQSGLTTQSDVTGRPQGTQNTAFSATPGGAETKTSGATGAGNTAQQQAVQQQTGRGMGGGMPMMPSVPMSGPGGGGGGSTRSGDGESKPVTSTSDPLGLMTERSQSVRGGTIAQNRPDHDKPTAA